MDNEVNCCNVTPKGVVLRKMAERYAGVDPEAMELMLTIQRIAKDAERTSQAALDAYGLSEGRFYVLAHLLMEEILDHKAPGPSEIAEKLGVTRATITGLLDGLERDEFLERRHDSADRRALTIHLTAKGRVFVEGYIPQCCGQARTQMAALDAEEKRTLLALLTKLQGQAL